MMKLAMVIAVVTLGACFQSHPSGQQELMGTDCYMCHTPDYNATTQPVHRDMPQVFSTTCADCHRTSNWKPALEGLHSDVFVIADGAHAKLACLGCHDLDTNQPSAKGANTNCIQCHPNDTQQQQGHAGVTSVAGNAYAYQDAVPNFCLQCHPSGIAGKHPDDKFPRTGGHNVACESCHDRTAGNDTMGANTTCTDSGCHPLVKMDASDGHKTTQYTTDRGPGTSRNFCLMCHPAGKSG